MTKHTSGPWEAKDVPSAGLEIFAKIDIGKEDMSNGILQPIYHVSLKPQLTVDDKGIVTMMLSFESWRQFPSIKFQEMQKANAHLIAAAPDLLEALKNFVDDEVCSFDHHGYCQTHGVSNPCINVIAKQAIVKAEGGK